MNNKNILIITPFFAPETHAAVFRAYKLVKYLKKEGWNPIVLTIDTNYNYNEDEKLLDELKDIPIYRTRYIEPSLRGLRMWLTCEDRTFKTLKAKGYYKQKEKGMDKENQPKESFFITLYNYILNHYLNCPDRFWTWQRSTVKMATKLIKEHDIKIIFTTSPPFTSGRIGLELKKKLNVKWIADFRDPMTTVLRNHSHIEPVYVKQRRLKHKIVEQADAITTASLAHKLILHDIFGGKNFDKIYFIPTGLDDEYLISKNNTEKNDEICFVYSGEYLIENGYYFFSVFSEILKDDKIKEMNIFFKVVGNKAINENLLKDVVSKYNLDDYIIFIDHLPQQKLYELLLSAKAALLLSEGRWWCSFAKMVDYIALEIPVLADVPEISEARTQLTKAGLGFFFSKNKEDDLALLKEIVINGTNKMSIDKDFCKRYLASSQVKSFIDIFERI